MQYPCVSCVGAAASRRAGRCRLPRRRRSKRRVRCAWLDDALWSSRPVDTGREGTMALIGAARSRILLGIGMFAGAALVSLGSAGAAAPSLFDKPVKTVKQALPKDKDNPQAKPALICSYYPHFMVKQIDLGGPGADQLSILPIAAGATAPPCKRDNVAGEIVLQDWSGYLKGVKG